jgi:hypothetical protein
MLTNAEEANVYREFQRALDAAYRGFELQHLPTVADDFDDVVLNLVTKAVQTNISSLIPGASKVNNRPEQFRFCDGKFTIVVDQDPRSLDTIVVSFLVLESGHKNRIPRTRQKSLRFASTGLIRRAMICYTEPLTFDRDYLLAFIQKLFTFAVNWFNEKIRLAVESIRTSLSSTLYDAVRSHLSPDQSKHIWFAAAFRGASFAIFDPPKAIESISTASDYSSKFGQSPVRMISEMLTYCVPFDTVAASVAVNQNKPIFINLENAAFRSKFPELAEAEMINLGGTEICVLPIARNVNTCLVVGFPTSPTTLFEFLNQTLSQLSEKLKAIFFQHETDLAILCEQATKRMRGNVANSIAESPHDAIEKELLPSFDSLMGIQHCKQEILGKAKLLIQMNKTDTTRFNIMMRQYKALQDLLEDESSLDRLVDLLEHVTSDLLVLPLDDQKLLNWIKKSKEILKKEP